MPSLISKQRATLAFTLQNYLLAKMGRQYKKHESLQNTNNFMDMGSFWGVFIDFLPQIS